MPHDKLPIYNSEKILAALDLDKIILSNLDFDPVGHYARGDIFEFKLLNQPGVKKE